MYVVWPLVAKILREATSNAHLVTKNLASLLNIKSINSSTLYIYSLFRVHQYNFQTNC